MHACWTLLVAASALAGSCVPMHRVPPPLFTPQPPYPPQPVMPGQVAPPTTTQPPPTAADASYPAARKTINPNEVISPFPPHHRIDITGFQPGQLARDPYTEQIFRIP